MLKHFNSIKSHATNPKVLGAVVIVGVTLTGIVVLADARRKRRIRLLTLSRADFGAFVDKFDLVPSPQPPPPAAMLPLTGLSFAISDIFQVKGFVTGFGNPEWARTHEQEEETSTIILTMLKSGATCIGKTVMDEFSLGLTGGNIHYGTPTNPVLPSHMPGGSSSGSAVAVSAKLVDFALGIDACGCVRIPAAYSGILGFRASHGCISTSGVLHSSPSLESIGWFARDPTVLHSVGKILLQFNAGEQRRDRVFVFADDLFELSMFPRQKTEHVVSKAIEPMAFDNKSKHMNIGQYIASRVPSLEALFEEPPNGKLEITALKALSRAATLLQRYEFKTKHDVWISSVKPKLSFNVFEQSFDDKVKILYRIKAETRGAMQNLLKDDKILVLPTVADPPPKLDAKKKLSSESLDRAMILSSIVSLSGCCQVAIPLGTHDDYPISVSLISYHGGDKFLLDTVLDLYSSLQTQASISSNLPILRDPSADIDASELLKEKGNAAFKRKDFNKAVRFYSEAIKLNGNNATYYSNRAAAFLELGSFRLSEEDCTKAISLDKKNVKAYLRRGTARESLMRYKEASQDFKHALVLEPQNKTANVSEKRLRKLMA